MKFASKVVGGQLQRGVLRPRRLLSSVRTSQAQATAKASPTPNTLPTRHDPHRSASQQDKLLFTPGPLTTSYTVKQAALRDLGSRDFQFINVVESVCSELLKVAGVSDKEYTSVPLQGSGTFAVEAVLSSAVPKDKKLVIIANGAYGSRMVQMAKTHKIPYTLLEYEEEVIPNPQDLESLLSKDGGSHSHIAVVHSETTSGIINDINKLGQVVKHHNRSFIVDAMSSFGGVAIDFHKANIDFLVSSANKCIEGIPGFAFAIARKSALEKCKDNARTVSLDIYAQRAGLDANKQFRFTPPTHALLAFHQALKELWIEGGVSARQQRYEANKAIVQEGFAKLGFKLHLPPQVAGCIISSFRYPQDSNWKFARFYSELNDLGYVIYPGKLSKLDCFRIGHIGRLFPEDSANLVKAAEAVAQGMKTAKFYKP